MFFFLRSWLTEREVLSGAEQVTVAIAAGHFIQNIQNTGKRVGFFAVVRVDVAPADWDRGDTRATRQGYSRIGFIQPHGREFGSCCILCTLITFPTQDKVSFQSCESTN